MLLAETEHGISGLDPSSCHNRCTFVLAIIFATVGIARAAARNRSRDLVLLGERPWWPPGKI